MIAKQDPQRIISTNIRTTASQLACWRDAYAESYVYHRLSFNAWIIATIERGLTQ